MVLSDEDWGDKDVRWVNSWRGRVRVNGEVYEVDGIEGEGEGGEMIRRN